MVDSQVITVPSTIQDITGQKFGRLAAVRYVGKVPHGDHRWLCVCECGTFLPSVRYNCLVRGTTNSCGCYKRDQINASKRNTRHGMWGTPTWSSWDAMISRCTRPANASYRNYGGRGITVCERWLTFENFYADMGDRPVGQELDRIDSDGNYEPNNCRWVTKKQQMRNKRSNVNITHMGKTMCVADWEEELGISRGAIYYRLKTGMPTERVLGMPVYRKKLDVNT